MPAPSGLAMSPAPTDEEAAAIVAAYETLWPKPIAMTTSPPPRNTSWRFGNRWWSLPVPARRNRPWR